MAKILRQLRFNIKRSESTSSSPVNEPSASFLVKTESQTSSQTSDQKNDLLVADFYSDPLDIKSLSTAPMVPENKPHNVPLEDNYCLPYETKTKNTVLRIDEATYEEPWDLDSTQLGVLKQLKHTLNHLQPTEKPTNYSCKCVGECLCRINASNSDTNLLNYSKSPFLKSTTSDPSLILEDSGIHSDEVSEDLCLASDQGLSRRQSDKQIVNDYYNTRSAGGRDCSYEGDNSVDGHIRVNAKVSSQVIDSKGSEKENVNTSIKNLQLCNCDDHEHKTTGNNDKALDTNKQLDVKSQLLAEEVKLTKVLLRKGGSKELGDQQSHTNKLDPKNWRRSTFFPETNKSEVAPYRCATVSRSPRHCLQKDLSAPNIHSSPNKMVESPWKRRQYTDPSVPLEEQQWYHGSISRQDGEDLLRSSKSGSFLVRMSESCRHDFSLSKKKKVPTAILR